MLSNEEIGIQLQTELDTAIAEYKSSNKFELTEKVFNELMSFNFARYQRRLKRDVSKKIKRLWINPKKGINPEQKLDAFLFEHDFPKTKNQEAELYGIVEWENKEIQSVVVDMGYSYDFADGLEQMSGIKTQFFNPFVKNKLGKEYYENSILVTDDKELAKCFQLKGVLAIHEVFTELNRQGAFDLINKNDRFCFMLREHDEECYLILCI
ncbi:hypothetical protein [Maribacter sp.]|uniref:hypothetical protein n=1 Tax=Maribacter sp. TaxID=1897614 RepID=UPI003299C976